MSRYHADKQAPKVAVDAVFTTDSPERKDFQVQVCFQQEVETMSTQTYSFANCDFQVQANIPRESNSIAVQTIKEEIAMPNLPSSVAQTPAKKRKMSSVSTSCSSASNAATIDLISPQNPIQNPIPGESGVNLNNQQVGVESTANRLNKKQAGLDDAILNSQVYKIYCRNEDPKEAMKEIKELKTCLCFEESTMPFPTEEVLKKASKKCLDTLWKMEPRLKDSKFTKIKKYTADGDINYDIYRFDEEMYKILDTCFTKIEILIPNGYEFWYISNFEKGKGASKWFRADSSIGYQALCLAQLNVMGVTKAAIDKFQYLEHLKQKSEKVPWFDFALKAVRFNRCELFRNNNLNIKLRVVTSSHLNIKF